MSLQGQGDCQIGAGASPGSHHGEETSECDKGGRSDHYRALAAGDRHARRKHFRNRDPSCRANNALSGLDHALGWSSSRFQSRWPPMSVIAE